MVNKPRRRKQESRRRTYLVVTIIAVLLIAGVWYLYSMGDIPFLSGNQSTATLTTSSTTSSTGSLVHARINTSIGSFEVELYSALAPHTVSNFVQLAQSGFYNNLVWHRIVSGFVVQTGDPNTRNAGGNRSLWGQGTSGTNIPFEGVTSTTTTLTSLSTTTTLTTTTFPLHNYAYYLGMASTGAGVGGSSQFYVNLADNTSLDGNYAVFGKVISGTSVVDAIGRVPVYTSGAWLNQPITPVYVTSVTILQSQ